MVFLGGEANHYERDIPVQSRFTWWHEKHNRFMRSGHDIQGYLARKKQAPPLGPPWGPMQNPSAGSGGGVIS